MWQWALDHGEFALGLVALALSSIGSTIGFLVGRKQTAQQISSQVARVQLEGWEALTEAYEARIRSLDERLFAAERRLASCEDDRRKLWLALQSMGVNPAGVLGN